MANKKIFKWLSYSCASSYLQAAKAAKVSKIARGPGGFMQVYKQKKTAKKMNSAQFSKTQTWGSKRYGFIARFLPQYNDDPTYRRFLALTMWAYKPKKPHH